MFEVICWQVAAFEAICSKAKMDGSVVNFLKARYRGVYRVCSCLYKSFRWF